MSYRYRPACRRGFTLIEMAIVLVIIGVVISIAATLLPALIQSAKMRKAQAIMERADLALEGYMVAGFHLPCPDVTGYPPGPGQPQPDGVEDRNGSDCSGYVGFLPFRTLGLASGTDAWNNVLWYSVYGAANSTTPPETPDLTDSFTSLTDLCTNGRGLQAASTRAFDNTRTYVADDAADTNAGNQAYIIASGGSRDADNPADGSFFDGLNSIAPAVRFEQPNRTPSATYDDLVRAVSFNTLIGSHCGTGGGAGGGGGGSTGTEICGNGLDDDGDGLVDCADPDCGGNALCQNVTVVPAAISPVKIDNTLSAQLQATGGKSYPVYYWSLVSTDPALGGKLSLDLWSGQLSGKLDVCEGSYPVTVKAEDRQDATNQDQKDLTVTVDKGTLTINPLPGGGGAGSPDVNVTSTTFSQSFSVIGDYVGPFQSPGGWSLSWTGADPGGFQVDAVGAAEANLRKSGASTAGDYAFTLTAQDAACPGNSVTSGTYTLHVDPAAVGSPYTANLIAEWDLDACSWSGSAGEVTDSGPGGLNGTAQGGATTIGSGHLCRSGSFDGNNDYVSVGDTPTLRLAPPFSLSLWVKVNANASDWVRLAGKGSSSLRNYGLWLATNGTVLFQVYSAGGTGNAQTSVKVNDGAWHHLVGVYDGSTLKTYVDDVERASVAFSQAPYTSTDPFTLGYAGFHTRLNGQLDEVMLFKEALSPARIDEIHQLTRTTCPGVCYTGPVAEYRMDETAEWSSTAGEVKDSAGSADGVALQQGSGVLPSHTLPAEGKVCRAARFTRVDTSNGGYLSLGDPVSGVLDPGTSPWTISTWFKWDGTSTADNIIYNKENLYEARVSGGFVGYAWRPHWVWDGGSTFPVSLDTWHHLTTVYDGRRQILYEDGLQVYSRPQTGAIGANGSNLLIGARTNGGNFFGGLIDELRIYDRALGENEIQQVMMDTHACP